MENYSRVKQIGEGAFGKAVLVKKKSSGEQAVIKEINISRMTSKEREESRKEVAVLAQLKHPNIVTYRESFEEKGSLYIVMDYCAGGDLYSRINNQRGLLFTEEQVWGWFIQICLAIKHVHDRKILHRDIKSQNIFLTSDGRVQVGDFGIAKVLNSTVELARTCIGTPYYLSPEIVENKPYNNKSDIWSLGCVLYELATLKHAFEGGNMKNLVLKIIRGSYTPIPPKYSYELRGLIAQLFKRAPRDRPSINSILKKNFIISRVRNLLPEEKMREEFSHTLLHGQKIARALPPPPRPASAGPKRATPSPRPGSAAGRYNPAAVYGAPVARKSKEMRPNIKKKGASGGRIIPGQQDWEKKKQDMIQKENKRREEMKKKEQDQYARQHKEFVDRQKMARINKAREEGWKSLVDPGGGAEDRPSVTPPPAAIRPLPKPVENNIPQKDRGNFDQYNDYLNKIRGDPKARVYEQPPVPAPRNNAGNYMAAPKPVQQYGQNKADRDYINRALQRGPPVNYAKQNEENRKAVSQANERARLAEEFLQRKREAALNKQRGHAQLYGYTPPATPIQRPGSARGGKPAGGGVNARNREEQEYLEKLRQIREHNMKDRRMLQGRVEDEKPKNDPKDVEARKKKMEALRKQAEEWSQRKKDDLEKEKKDIFDRMRAREEYMKQREQKARNERPVTPLRVDMKPVAAVPITGALHAIGAGNDPPSPERPKSAKQQEKDDILKRLNDKSRGQWENPHTPDLAIQEEDDGSETSRSKWGDAEKGHLANLPLEQTASQMEATSAGDKVVRPGVSSPPVVTPRNQWGKPGGTVVGVLEKLPVICDATMTIDSKESGGSTSSEGFEPSLSPKPVVPPISTGVGATITISKTPVQKGTITIKAAENAAKSNAAKGADADTADKTLKAPEVVRSQGAGSLFDKVELEEEEEEEEKDTKVKKQVAGGDSADSKDVKERDVDESGDGNKLVTKGITTGHFDLNDIGLLRTASEPDLSKLGKTESPAPPLLSRHISMDLSVVQEETETSVMESPRCSLSEEASSPWRSGSDKDRNGSVGGNGDEDNSDDDDDDDDDDLISVRATMQSLLIDDDTGSSNKIKFSLSNDAKSEDQDGDPDSVETETPEQEDNASEDQGKDREEEEEAEAQEDEEEEEEEVEEEEEELLRLEDDEENREADLFDDSDGETQFGDDDYDDADLFSRLEQQRAELESALGDKLIDVYKAVQAMQEDEDGNIEEAVQIGIKLLGKEHEHLYPKIFHLVIADTAYTEDNV